MVDFHLWSRKPLLLPEVIEAANLFLTFARSISNPTALLLLSGNISTILSAMKRGARKSLNPQSAEDQDLCRNIASIFTEHGNLWERLNDVEKAKVSFEKAEKWRESTLTSRQKQSRGSNKAERKFANLPLEIFTRDVCVRLDKPKLPMLDARLSSTPQLVYSLTLLSNIPSSPNAVTAIDGTLDETERSWLQSMTEDVDEQNRLYSLAGKMVEEYINDDMRETVAVAEVVSLAPVLTKDQYRKLLNQLVVRFEQAKLLEFRLLDGIAQLIQNAPDGHLLLADLVSVLDVLSTRLRSTHQQSSTDLYALVRAVSNVLDAMADCDVKGLSREEKHEPLSRYLDSLKNDPDLYLVYHATYAYQALQYVPNDESSPQSVLRCTRVMVSGISGLVSAVKSLDLNKFLDGLEDIDDFLTEVCETMKIGFKSITATVELVDSGVGLWDSLKEGLSFSHKCAWYPALRGLDVFIRNGHLTKFKRLVCEAPCRRDAAFQLGVCQRLGKVAANPSWDNKTRQHAVDFLRELYTNDAEWGKQASNKKWVLTVLVRLTMITTREIKEYTSVVLKDLERSGDGARQELYRAHVNTEKETPSSFPLEAVPQTPLASLLLTRAQDVPDTKEDLRRLKKRQLRDRTKAVYIPPCAKASRQAPDSASFDLMKNMMAFLNSGSQVFLLLGDSGAGKSTFNRELEYSLWNSYRGDEDAIPLFIHLPSIDNPEKDLVAKHLRRCDFSEPQIRELKNNRHFTLICDGYDECKQIYNLYTSNNFNGNEQWKAKMVISCRSEHFGHDYKDRFQPLTDAAALPGGGNDQLQEAVIVPFSTEQIHDYIHRYVADIKPPWHAKSYITALEKIPNLMDLIRNPFLLTLSLDVLPGFVDVDKIQDLSDVHITRVGLYDRFIKHWLERGKKRVGDRELSQKERAVFDTIVDEGFTANGIDFLKRLAAAIYKEQAGHPIVEYSRFKDGGTWKAEFFSRKDESRLLREACPLARNGNQYRFVHKSLLEYCFTRAVFDPQASSASLLGSGVTYQNSVDSMISLDREMAAEGYSLNTPQAVLSSPLRWMSFVKEPSILQLLGERVQQEPDFKKQLRMMIEHSKIDKDGGIAAANAITILVRAGVQFIGADLRGIRIPGADLSFGVFEQAQLQGADMSEVNFSNVWLRQADLSDSQMAGVRFGEWPYLKEVYALSSFAYSPDGKSVAVGLYDFSVVIYDTVTWTKTRTLRGHTSVVYTVAYSSDGNLIASGSHDTTVRLWDTQTGETILILDDHTDPISSVMFSPNGRQIASCSRDKSVRLWDTQTGTPGLSFTDAGVVFSLAYSPDGHQIALGCGNNSVRLKDTQTGDDGTILTGHTGSVRSLVYSPSGHQIASGSDDSTVRLWDTQAGCLSVVLNGHSDSVYSVAYSPSGHQIASGSADKTVRLWDAQTGTPGPILTGHYYHVRKVSYSPSGHQIASGSEDGMIRLWDAQTGTPNTTGGGHTSIVTCVAWSPCGAQIASGSGDHSIRLWDAQTGASGPVLTGHTNSVNSVVYSPSGDHLASVGDDHTIRLWNARTGALERSLSGHADSIRSVVYSPSGHQLASGSHDNTVRLWDARTGASEAVLIGHTGVVQSVMYSPTDHHLASGSNDETVRLWDAQTGLPLSVLSGHSGSVRTVTYSPSGHQIASGSQDKTVRVWDVKSGSCTLVLSDHTDQVWTVAYSSRGDRIASCSEDGSVRLWDVVTGDCLTSMNDVDKPIRWLAWRNNDDGSYLATGNEGATVRMWQLTEKESRPHFQLQWSSPHGSLNAMGANIQDVHGLSWMQIKVLKQRGNVGEPILPLSIRSAGEKVANMVAVVHRLKVVPKKERLGNLAENSLAGKAELAIEE